ncbi:GTPase required for pre-60S ribosomal subunit nuclear export and maturation, partial [Ceratobasidium sp. 395]
LNFSILNPILNLHIRLLFLQLWNSHIPGVEIWVIRVIKRYLVFRPPHRSPAMAPTKPNKRSSAGDIVTLRCITDEDFYRDAQPSARVKMSISGKAVRDRDGKIVVATAF